jgi:hypothetical protein
MSKVKQVLQACGGCSLFGLFFTRKTHCSSMLFHVQDTLQDYEFCVAGF